MISLVIPSYNNLRHLKNAYNSVRKHYTDKVELILQHLNSEDPPSVPDPYYGDNDGFEHVYQLLDTACQKVIDKIKQNL